MRPGRVIKMRVKKEINRIHRASYTVEAAVIMPVYLCLSAAIFMFFFVFRLSWGVQVAACETARETAVSGEVEDGQLLSVGLALCEGKMLAQKLPVEHVAGGWVGINLLSSEVTEKDICINATYKVRLPIRMFGVTEIDVGNHVRSRRWTGYDPHEGEGGSDFVYVTPYGRVYHTHTKCPYLDLSIHAIAKSLVGKARNSSGAKYYACPICGGDASMVYITDYGTNYHSSIACSGLKRTVYKITRAEAEAKGMGGCSKCGR